MSMIEISGVKKSFGDSQVLKGIDLTVDKGDVIAILGPSGSGKTTFLRCINFLERADGGNITFDGEKFDLKSIHKRDINRLRKKTAFVFQNYNLFANKSVLENVSIGLRVARKVSKADAERKSLEMLKKVGLMDKAASYPIQLSGGQQQRVAIARALATDPEVIYFDEPTSALDPELIGEVLSVMKNLADEGMTMLVVTHELNFAKNVSTKVMLLEDGITVESGATKDFFENPQETRSREFIKTISTIHE